MEGGSRSERRAKYFRIEEYAGLLLVKSVEDKWKCRKFGKTSFMKKEMWRKAATSDSKGCGTSLAVPRIEVK